MVNAAGQALGKDIQRKKDAEPPKKDAVKKQAAGAKDFAAQEAALKPEGAQKKEGVQKKAEVGKKAAEAKGPAEKKAAAPAKEEKKAAAPAKEEKKATAPAKEEKKAAAPAKEEKKVAAPAKVAKTAAALPESSDELMSSPDFQVKGSGAFSGVGMPKNVAAMLMAGIKAEGVSDATSLKQALEEYVDNGQVSVRDIKVSGGASLKWLSFYSGDTEVGYIFDGGSLKAIVSDGFINQL
jgi:outer membrane biosynthesis protein TonB